MKMRRVEGKILRKEEEDLIQGIRMKKKEKLTTKALTSLYFLSLATS